MGPSRSDGMAIWDRDGRISATNQVHLQLIRCDERRVATLARWQSSNGWPRITPAGQIHFHLLVDDDGAVLGRFNLVDVADGSADLGFRVAERVSGRGVARDGVRRVCRLARDEYGLNRLTASAALANPASLAVLRHVGFAPIGDVVLSGKPGLRHVLDL
jgi:RimJ/RimL family protein N-acetyltransferase